MNPRFQSRIQKARRQIARGRGRAERDLARIAERVQMTVDLQRQWRQRPIAALLGALALGMAASRLLAGKTSRLKLEQWLDDAATTDSWMRFWRSIMSEVETPEDGQSHED